MLTVPAGRRTFSAVLIIVVALGALVGLMSISWAEPAAAAPGAADFMEIRAGDLVMRVDRGDGDLVRAARTATVDVEKAWSEVLGLWPDLGKGAAEVSLRRGPAYQLSYHLEQEDPLTGGTRVVVPRRGLPRPAVGPSEETELVAYVVAAAIHQKGVGFGEPPPGADVVAEGVGWWAALVVSGRDPGQLARAARTMSPAYPLSTVLGFWRAIPAGAEQIASFFSFVGRRFGGGALTVLERREPSQWRRWPGFAAGRYLPGYQGSISDLQPEWMASLGPPSDLASREAAATVRWWRLWGLVATVAGVTLVGGLLLLLAGPAYRRRGLNAMVAAYLGLSLLEYGYGTSNLNPYVKVAFAYVETALVIGVVLVLVRRRREGKEGSDVPAWLFISGYFLLTMALRLPIYGEVREVWAKAPHLMLVLASVFLLEKKDWASLGLVGRRFRAQILLIMAGFLVYRLADASGNFLGVLALGGGITGVYAGLGTLNPLWMAFRFFYGNFVEELFFRSYVQTRLERHLPFAAATAVQALLFGLYHVNYNMFPPDAVGMGLYVLFAAVFGVQMTLLYRSTGSLWVPVVAHPLANLGVFQVLFWGSHGGQWQSDVGQVLGHTARLLVSLWLIPRLLGPVAKAVAPGGQADPYKLTAASIRKDLQETWHRLRRMARLSKLRNDFARAPLLDRMMFVFWVVSVPVFIYLLVFSPVGGRPVMGVFLILVAVSLVLAAYARRRHRSTLKELAEELGLDYLETADQEKGNPLLDNLKWHYLADVYRWKLAGHHPFAAGTYHGLPVIIRRPLAVDFDLAAPDSTRIGVYARPHIEGFMIYSSRRKPKGKRWIATADAAFDAKFAVSGQVPEEVAAILDADVRRALLALDRVGLTGIEVSRFGVLYYEPGLVSDAETVRDILDALTLLAGRAQAFGTE